MIARLSSAPTSDADVVERLFLEFEPVHGLKLLSEVVQSCRAELRDSAPLIASESLDDLVRERLASRSATARSSRMG